MRKNGEKRKKVTFKGRKSNMLQRNRGFSLVPLDFYPKEAYVEGTGNKCCNVVSYSTTDLI